MSHYIFVVNSLVNIINYNAGKTRLSEQEAFVKHVAHASAALVLFKPQLLRQSYILKLKYYLFCFVCLFVQR